VTSDVVTHVCGLYCDFGVELDYADPVCPCPYFCGVLGSCDALDVE
jgi:hypothetical protein